MLVKYYLIQIFKYLYPPGAVYWAAQLFAIPRRIPRPPHENELIKKAERLVLKCGLVAYKFGTQGKPILLVHGWEGRGTQLGAFAEPLVRQGYVVYALDGPAHGESPGKAITPTLFATFLKTVTYEIGPLKAIIAHSFGAASSILAASNHLPVEKIVFIAGPDRYTKVVENYCSQIKISGVTKELFYKEIIRRVGIHPDQMQVSLMTKEVPQDLMLVHDRGDKSVAYESSERIHAAFPSSKLLTTEGLGHRRILKDPQVIAQVVDFIG